MKMMLLETQLKAERTAIGGNAAITFEVVDEICNDEEHENKYDNSEKDLEHEKVTELLLATVLCIFWHIDQSKWNQNPG